METIKLICSEHKLYYKQLFMLAKSDLVKTYRGAALGWAWAVIKPMMTLFVFWFGFTVGLRSGKPINGYPYFLWLVGGFLPWFFMQEMILSGTACIRQYKHLVTKMKFPVSIIPTYVNISHYYVNFVLTFIAILLFWVMGHAPDLYYLQLPIYAIMMLVFFIAYSMFAGMLSAISRDFHNMVKASNSAIFWLSGIIFNVDRINHRSIRILMKFNPITDIATGYRNCFIYKQWIWEDKWALLGYTTTTLLFILGALWAFKRLRKEIPDVL